MKPAEPAVLFDKKGATATVSLNRPRVLNAYNMAMRDALYEALEAVRDDAEIRVLILRGNGPAFCTGGDLTEFGRAESAVAARQARWRRDVWGLLARLDAITIAAVHGLVVGGGFEMALLCDLCMASRDARFFYPETGLAMIPGVCGTQTTPRLAGWGRALDLVLSGRELTATEAMKWGLVTSLVSPGRLDTAAERMARRVATLPAGLAMDTKRAVCRGVGLPLDQGLALERVLAEIRCEDAPGE